MGRRLPFDVSHSIQPAISLALIVAWMAALVAMVTALCGVRSKKSTTTKSSQHWDSASLSSAQGKASEEPETASATATAATETETIAPLPLPLPPALQQQGQEQSAASSPGKPREGSNFPWLEEHGGSPKSRRGMMVSLSVKLPDTLLRIKTGKEMLRRKLHGDDKAEDSLWTKHIMLGERSRVPHGDVEDDDNNNNNIHDDKGNLTTPYNPKTPRSLPASRSSSYIDPRAIPTRKL